MRTAEGGLPPRQRALLTLLACSGAPVFALGAVLEPLLERFVSDDESEA
jgi:hypothetical protein